MTTNPVIWGYRKDAGHQDSTDLAGFGVEALDGRIGKVVDVGKHETYGSYLVVDTGPWIFGRLVVLPAGAVSLVDLPREMAFVDRTRQEIKDAPEFDRLIQPPEAAYLERLGSYYGALYSRHGI
ncbi:hypothetical protein [Streptacidiphilus rugosus]|uniref:hypothetical protein n=1 Tax=Streptacidiphilus rugosus TaxID=405783 RepID=UPI000565D3D9|nr:hypothetical protein [Streptacidiphilus rugosus]